MKTKLFTLLFALVASVGTLFASNIQVDGIWYDFDSSTKTASVTFRGIYSASSSNEYTGAIVIPSFVTYNSVTYTITSIGKEAFAYCSGLTSVTIPNSVTSIGSSAFQDCRGLTSVTIPNSVTSVGDNAFLGCSGLTSINVTSDNSNYCSVDGVLFNKDKTTLIQYPGSKQGAYTIPNSVTSIGDYAFKGCTGLTSVTIGNSVTSIGSRAFQNCSGLTSVTIPNSVTSIGESAFNGCSGLTSVVWNAKNYSNCDQHHTPFYYDGYISTNNYDSKRSFDLRSQITSFTFGNEVEHIPAYLCKGISNLTSVTIPNGVTNIGSSAFQDCRGLTSVTIGSSVTSIGNYAFAYCSGLTSVTIGSSVTSIGSRAFLYCSGLTSVTIPNSVTSIGDSAFEGCSGLTSVTIPNSVTSIGGYAFDGCTGLTSVTLNSNAIVSKNYSFNSSLNTIFGGQVPEYIIIGDDVTSIGDYAFYGCTGLTSVTIPNSVTSIGNYAFYGCTGLTSVTIPNSVTSIGGHAFQNCSGLTSVTIPNSVTSLGDYAFCGCTGLTSVTIPNSVTSIGDSAFEGCSGLTSVTIPNSVTSIGGCAFENCTGLTSVTIPNSVTSIGAAAFEGCSGLTSVTIEAETPPTLSFSVFNNTNNCPIYVPCGTVNAYKSSWSIVASKIYTAPFPYTITTNAENGTVSTTSTKSYTICDVTATITCTATPDNGYHFTQWSDGNTDNPRTIILASDTSFTAEFAKNTYTISTTSANPEWGTTAGGKSALYLDEVKISATANYGYHFVKWNDYNTSNPRIVSVTGDETYTAIFAKDIFSITANAEHGSISGPSKAEYLDNVTLAATPQDGYHFTQWSDGITTNPRTFVLTQDTTFTAEFAHNLIITYVYDPHMGNVIGPTTTVSGAAENITFHATPNYGYHFVQWSDGNTENPRTIWLSQDTTFTAEFAVDKSGTCGKDNLLQWNFADDGTLTISGNGELTENYTFGVEAPTQMQQLVIGNEVTSIGERAFYEKTTLQKLIIGSNVTSIGKYAFANINNPQLTSLVLPAELLTIGDDAFSGNTYLESIDFNAKLQSIGSYAFKDCYRVSEMTCLATVTPNVGTDALASINSYASLCVPAECLRKYQVDPNWGRFDLCELGASSTTTDGKTVIVEPSDNTALFTWPTENNAGSYTLQISKDGEVFCTLVFNSNGQLTGIAFAPGRNGAAHAPAATMSVAGMSFTVTGLDGASKYAYRLAVTNDASEELVAYSGEFATTGYTGEVNPGGNPEGIEDVPSSLQGGDRGRLILYNGQIFILRGDKIYNAQGALVK